MMKRYVLLAAVVLALGYTCALAARIDVFPPNINLSNQLDRQQFIVVLTRDDGVTEDITQAANAHIGDDTIARLEGRTVLPAGDGKTELKVEHQGQSLSIPVEVTTASAARPISFKLDVMPVFMRAGCNTGGCHGSARGQDGFRLSLFGFDPDGDHFRLTRELGFRRINLAMPEDSLLLEKAIGTVQHTGGKRFDKDSPYYKTLRQWIEAGALNDAGAVPVVTAVDLYPPQAVLEGAGSKQPFLVRAKYADGSDRDVTDLAVFFSNNDNSAPISPEGLVTAAKRGEAFVLARFATTTVGSQVIVLPKGTPYTPPTLPPANYIDELVNAKLAKLRITPSGLCNDAAFIRRATLDIIGLLPTEAETLAFLADASPDKRAKLVDQLLARPQFAELWAMYWAEILMIRSTQQVSTKAAYLYSTWLTEKIAAGEPFDKIVRELLTASGGTFDSPAANFYQVETDPMKLTENVAQAFAGIRIQCAQCHNHPFDRWTMDDYYGFNAFFAQIARKPAEDDRETIVFNRGSGESRHPVGGRVMPPKFLGGAAADAQGDRREALAQWLTAPDNPYFAVSVANRLWAHYLGVGIVEPVDDVRVSNPPSNPQLYEALGRKLVEYKYDFRKLVRDICLSQAYQRATAANESNREDTRNFAHALDRRLRAEILLDCVSQVTETKDKFRGLPLGARAVQIADGAISDYFLTTFGRAPRESVSACDVNLSPTLSQALHLLNGQTLENKIRNGGAVKRLLAAGKSPEQVIETLYLRAFSRPPTDVEREKLKARVGDDPKLVPRRLDDLFWALLNSREFVFNH